MLVLIQAGICWLEFVHVHLPSKYDIEGFMWARKKKQAYCGEVDGYMLTHTCRGAWTHAEVNGKCTAVRKQGPHRPICPGHARLRQQHRMHLFRKLTWGILSRHWWLHIMHSGSSRQQSRTATQSYTVHVFAKFDFSWTALVKDKILDLNATQSHIFLFLNTH